MGGGSGEGGAVMGEEGGVLSGLGVGGCEVIYILVMS